MNHMKKWKQSVKQGAVLCAILICLTGCGNTADSKIFKDSESESRRIRI